jgi:hypothetical protein
MIIKACRYLIFYESSIFAEALLYPVITQATCYSLFHPPETSQSSLNKVFSVSDNWIRLKQQNKRHQIKRLLC